jgi:hypothetical protein
LVTQLLVTGVDHIQAQGCQLAAAMCLPTALEFAEQATQHLAAIQQVVLVTCSPINLIFLSDESIMFT